MDPRWKHPFTCLLAGPTGCGKTVFASNLVNRASYMIHPPPENIIWVHDDDDSDSLKGVPPEVTLSRDVADIEHLTRSKRHLVIVDDKMGAAAEKMLGLFTKGSHHRNISIVYIVQNLFDQNKYHRTISLNTHYLVLFKSPRDSSQISTLARQVYPGKSKAVMKAYARATADSHGYLLLDFRQETDDELRLRTDLFPTEEKPHQKVFTLL